MVIMLSVFMKNMVLTCAHRCYVDEDKKEGKVATYGMVAAMAGATWKSMQYPRFVEVIKHER